MFVDRVNEIFGRPDVPDEALMEKFHDLGGLSGDSKFSLSNLTRPSYSPGRVEFRTRGEAGELFLWRIEDVVEVLKEPESNPRFYRVRTPGGFIPDLLIKSTAGRFVDDWQIKSGDQLAVVFRLEQDQPTSHTQLYRVLEDLPHCDGPIGPRFKNLQVVINLAKTPTATKILLAAIESAENAPKVAREVELLAKFGKNGHNGRVNGILNMNGK